MTDERNPRRRLAIFARAPVHGRVKTRLAKTIGDEAALAAYEDLLDSTLARLNPGSGAFVPEIWLEGDRKALSGRALGFPVLAQPAGDLGARMAAAFEAGVTALVGCDIPSLTAGYVDASLVALADADLVLGPTEDGGYCLIAMAKPHVEVFAGVPWGTSAVLAATLDAARHLRVALLDELWDVDDAADLARWRRDQASRQREQQTSKSRRLTPTRSPAVCRDFD